MKPMESQFTFQLAVMFRLFLTSFLQVFFVSANTYFLASINWIGVAVCGWVISFLWTSNVRKVSTGNMTDRLVYSTGAMLGGLFGLLMATML